MRVHSGKRQRLPALASVGGSISDSTGGRKMRPHCHPACTGPAIRWGKFDVAGFRIEADNHFHAECDVQVRDAEGKVLFAQPNAISRDAKPDYPERYLPGIFSLEIRPGTPKGQYAIAVISRDQLSGQSSESVFPFAID